MGAVEKPLTLNQKILMEAAGQESNRDWAENLGDTRLLASRVMIKKLIRLGGEDTLSAIAEYFGVQIIKEKDVFAAKEFMEKASKDKRTYTYEYVEELLFKRMNESKRAIKERNSQTTTIINNQPVTIKISLVEE